MWLNMLDSGKRVTLLSVTLTEYVHIFIYICISPELKSCVIKFSNSRTGTSPTLLA